MRILWKFQTIFITQRKLIFATRQKRYCFCTKKRTRTTFSAIYEKKKKEVNEFEFIASWSTDDADWNQFINHKNISTQIHLHVKPKWKHLCG